jgi:hypothetical protein
MPRKKNNEPAGIEPVKLISGFIYRHRDIYISVLEKMEGLYGPVELESEVFDFSHTPYYEKEMGNDLKRCFVSFEEPISPGRLRQCKLDSNRIEKEFLNDTGGRTINIDPGMIGLANLVLASTKNFAHRLYLGDGIYGEVSMIYTDGEFTSLGWTYPDYKTDEVVQFLLRVRESLKDHVIILRQKDQ